MNRRILLVDADPGFQETLTDAVRRYGFDVHVELNPEQAFALASADPPALLIIGVEEPEKSGFKLFQRCKKGALGKVPLMLITESVAPDSFAKHKNLKTHADAYLDKRTYTVEELLGKIDGMVPLGEPIVEAYDAPTVLGDLGDDLDIPVEVDDIPLGDGDMVLEEEVAADDLGDDFGGDQGSMAPFGAAHAEPSHAAPIEEPAAKLDSMVD